MRRQSLRHHGREGVRRLRGLTAHIKVNPRRSKGAQRSGDKCPPNNDSSKKVHPASRRPQGVEEFVVDRLHDLANGGHPPPQALGPGFKVVAFRRVDEDECSVTIEPAPR